MLAYIFWHRPFSPHRPRTLRSVDLRFQADARGCERRQASSPPRRSGSSRCRGSATSQATRTGVCSKAPGPWTRSTRSRWRARCRRRTTPLPRRWSKATAASMPMPAAKRGHRRRSSVYWLTRPRGIDWRAALEPVRANVRRPISGAGRWFWGPPPSLHFEVPGDTEIEVPPGWQARRDDGACVWPTAQVAATVDAGAAAAPRPSRTAQGHALRREQTHGEGGVCRAGRDGLPDGRPSEEQGRPRGHGLQPHRRQGREMGRAIRRQERADAEAGGRRPGLRHGLRRQRQRSARGHARCERRLRRHEARARSSSTTPPPRPRSRASFTPKPKSAASISSTRRSRAARPAPRTACSR